MERIKKIIIFLGILICFLLIVIFINLLTNRDDINLKEYDENETITEDNPDFNVESSYKPDITLSKVDNKNKYYAVKSIIINYISTIKEINGNLDGIIVYPDDNVEEMKKTQREEGLKKIYDILDVNYVKEMNIKNDNLIKEASKYKTYDFIIKNMYISERTSGINIYIVEIKIGNLDTSLMVKIDSRHDTFSIFLEDYMKQNNYSINMNESDIKISTEEIKENENNIFSYINVSDETVSKDYFDNYKEKAINNSETAYDILDETYREKRFQTLENYKKYVIQNKNKIENAKVEKYKVNNYDDYTEYVCIDNYGNYYIFKETAIMDYTLILDTYTIDIPEVTEKYNKSSAKEKVGMNINKIFSAINQKDYSYVYGKLDETFKQNNYKNEQELEKYLKNNLYDQNKISFEAYEQRDDIHIFVVNVANYDNESETKNIKIIMQLKEGTDYVMSFSTE